MSGVLFDVYPRIVPADAETVITVAVAGGAGGFNASSTYEVTCLPMERIGGGDAKQLPARVVDGTLELTWRAGPEQEYDFVVEEAAGEEKSGLGSFRAYALREDLLSKGTYKGDLHLHSDRSDGKQAPGRVAAACREIGLDFMALTDHGRYNPSLEAIAAFEGVDTDLRMFPGEEIHPPQNPVHMINFGGSFSVNDLFSSDGKKYAEEVAAIQRENPDPRGGECSYEYASCLWTYRKTRESGGLSIFCHPYWITGHGYNVREALIERHFREKPFDAYELMGGFGMEDVESNVLQASRYHEERASGNQVAIVGSSDGHDCLHGDLFGSYYTVVFANSGELADLVAGIKGLNSVAVDKLPGTTPRVHGPFRPVKYAHFLLREVFPGHDALCREEGEAMAAHVAGNADAAGRLKSYKGRVEAFMNRLRACPPR
jgi:hypothetical protein